MTDEEYHRLIARGQRASDCARRTWDNITRPPQREFSLVDLMPGRTMPNLADNDDLAWLAEGRPAISPVDTVSFDRNGLRNEMGSAMSPENKITGEPLIEKICVCGCGEKTRGGKYATQRCKWRVQKKKQRARRKSRLSG